MKRLEWCFDSAMPDYWDVTENASDKSSYKTFYSAKEKLTSMRVHAKEFMRKYLMRVMNYLGN